MKGRILLTCSQCQRTREIAGEIPGEYTISFADAVHVEGWVPRPGAPESAFLCGDCLGTWAGHESVDDAAKIEERGDSGESQR